MNRRELKFRAAGWLGSWLLKGLGHTLRVRVEGREPLDQLRREGQPVIFTFWHSRILQLSYLHRNEGIVALVSEHGDGEYVTRIIERMGFGTARGSSTQGGARGLRALMSAFRAGHDLAFTPDGPTGPLRKFKTGALVAAQLTGAPLMPLTAGGPRAWRLGSWDRHVVPRPFMKVTLKYGDPVYIPRKATEAELEAYARELEQELNRICASVDGEEIGPGEPSQETLPSPGRRE